MVAHHNNLKYCLVPKDKGELISPTRRTGDIQVVEKEIVLPSTTTPEQPRQRLRPPHLRQNVRPPDRYTP